MGAGLNESGDVRFTNERISSVASTFYSFANKIADTVLKHFIMVVDYILQKNMWAIVQTRVRLSKLKLTQQFFNGRLAKRFVKMHNQ